MIVQHTCGSAQRLASVSAVVLTLALDCGPSRTVVHEFDLPTCPDSAFSLPKVVRQPPYELERLSEPGYCSLGYRKSADLSYHLTENGRDRSYYTVRLIRRPSCSLAVAYSYGVRDAEHDAQGEADLEPWLQRVAQLVLAQSGVAPAVPAARILRFDRRKDVDAWCAKPG